MWSRGGLGRITRSVVIANMIAAVTGAFKSVCGIVESSCAVSETARAFLVSATEAPLVVTGSGFPLQGLTAAQHRFRFQGNVP